MAGLRHNPAARYCSKRTEDDYDPDAVCDYCSAKGFDKGGPLPAGLTTVANNTGEPEPVGRPQLANVLPEKPAVALFFEKLGIVKGQRIDDVRTIDGHRLAGTYDIVEVNGYEDKEIVITLREPGVRTMHRVVWSKVVAFSTT